MAVQRGSRERAHFPGNLVGGDRDHAAAAQSDERERRRVLTGKKQDVDLISKRLGLYTEVPADSETRHAATVLIGNEPAGQWILNSAFDNPRFLAVMIGDWLNSWKGGAVAAGKSYADAAPITITEPGQYIFATHCSACHTIGQGDRIGPDLLGVTQHRDQAWLKHFIAAPTTVSS